MRDSGKATLPRKSTLQFGFCIKVLFGSSQTKRISNNKSKNIYIYPTYLFRW